MRQLIAYFIRYPVSVNTLLLIIAVAGAIAYTQLTASFFPLTPNRIISIQLIYPGASPQEIEEGVVNRIEEELVGVSGVERISSSSNENAAQIQVEVEKGYDRKKALEDVENAVNRINSFPSGLEQPVVFLQENVNFTISYAIHAKDLDLRTSKQYARKIEKDLLNAEGISKVSLSGFPEEEIEIAFNEESLRQYNISLTQASDAVRNRNLDITGGSVRTEEEELLIRSRNKGYYARELEEIVLIGDRDGGAVLLKDVASVSDRWSEDPNRILINGNPAVEIQVSSTDREDLLENAEYVRTYFEEFNKTVATIQATLIRDQSETLNERKDLLVENGAIGALLVLLLLSIFLNIRVALWVAIGLPISFLGMFVLALYYGVTINVISLFGMIVVVGILVDDGIVISENIYSHYEKGKGPVRAAIDGTMEVLPAVLSAILTTIVAFSFFFMVDGRAGDYFSELAFVVIATLLVSIIEAMIILPAHIAHSKALKRGGEKNWFERKTDKMMFWMRDKTYAPFLRFALNHKFFVLSIIIGLMVVTVGAMKGGMIKFTFFPNIERNSVPVQMSMAAGTREHITNDRLEKIEEAALKVNERLKEERTGGKDMFTNIVRRIGPGAHQGSLDISLMRSEERDLSSLELAGLIRDENKVFDAEKLTFGSTSPFGKQVSVTMLSSNIEELNAGRAELKSSMMAIPELKDVIETIEQGRREVKISLKPKAYLLGLTEAQVLSQVRQGYFGFEVQRLQRGKDEVKVWVRYDDKQRSSISDLENMRVRTAEGRLIPLNELVDFKVERGITQIDHIDGQRQATIEADLSSKEFSAPEIISRIREEIMPKLLAQNQSITPLYEGQNREAAKTQNSARFALPVVLLGILAIITFTFRSFAQSLIILFLLVPFSFIGVAWGHYFHGQQLSILSFLGIVALIGIIVNDSLVLVSKLNSFLKEGIPFKEAIFQAGYVRFRAIFLTSLTTVAGLAPLILEKSFQAQFLVPMAIAVAYGITIATVLTLVMLPIFLLAYNDLKRYAHRVWNGTMPTAEEVEPAVKELIFEDENA